MKIVLATDDIKKKKGNVDIEFDSGNIDYHNTKQILSLIVEKIIVDVEE